MDGLIIFYHFLQIDNKTAMNNNFPLQSSPEIRKLALNLYFLLVLI